MTPASPPRPRAVEASGCHWLDHDDGTVERVVFRKVTQPEGVWLELRFRAATEPAALALVARWHAENYERITRAAGRRARWGPDEVRR